MEKLSNHNKINDKKSAVLRLALAVSFVGAQAQLESAVLPQFRSDFSRSESPTVIFEDGPPRGNIGNEISLFPSPESSQIAQPIEKISTSGIVTDNSPGREIVEVFSPSTSSEPTPKPLTKEQKKSLQYKNELNVVLKQMQAHRGMFSAKYFRDVKMYYRIYKEVAEKYHMKWYLLWIVHEAETGASAGKKGFLSTSYYKWGFQIAPMWQKYAKQASKGLGDLKKLKTRHGNDWEQAALAAWILNRTMRGNHVHSALRNYSSRAQADIRFKKYERYRKNVFK